MRNLKKLLAVVLAVTVMLSVMATVAFADTAISANAQTCTTLGMLKGAGNGVDAAYTATQPSRIQAAVLFLRLKGLESAALAATGNNFTDVTAAWEKPYTAYLLAHQELGFAGIGNNMFDPDSKITAQQYYKIVLTALGYTEGKDFQYADTLTFAASKGLSAVATASPFTVDNLAAATVEGLKAKVADGSKTLIASLVASGAVKEADAISTGLVSSALKVASTTVKNSSTLTVTFSKAVADDVTKATFAVVCTDSNSNKITISTTPTWSTDKSSVDLATSGKLLKGSYSITVGGLSSLAADGNVGTATVAAEKVASIKFLGTKLIKVTDANHAAVGYQVFNQYNEDVTKAALAASLTWISSVGTATDDNAGTVTVDKGSAFASTDSVILTAIESVSGTTANATFSYATALGVKSVAFGTPVLPSGKTRVETGLNPAVSIPLTVTDEFGNTITNTTTITNALRFISSDSNATLSVGTDINSKPVLNVSTVGVTSAETITATVINVANGQTFTTSVSVVKPAAPDSVSFGSFTGVVASGDTSIVLPIVAADQFGNNLSADDIASNAGAFAVSSSNTTVIPNSWAISTYGSNKGSLVFSGTVGSKGSAVVTITVSATGKSASYTISVNDARHPNVVTLPSSMSTYLIQGATASFAASYTDQYGKSVSTSLLGASFTDMTKYKVNVTLTQASGAAGCVTINNTGYIDPNTAAGSSYYTLTAATGKTGSYKLAVKLIDVVNSNAVISEVDKIITVVANNQTGLTYSVNDIPKLAGNVAHAYPSPYARKVSVVAKDASGNSYAIPSSAIFNVVSSDTSVVTTASSSGSWYVQPQDIHTRTADATATINVFVNTDNGIQQFSKTVTVSTAAPVAQQMFIWDTAVTNSYTPSSIASVIDEEDFANRASANTGDDSFYIYTLDQYGVYTLASSLNAVISDATKANGAGHFNFDGTDTFALVGSMNYKANTPIYVAFFDPTSNVSATVKVIIVAEEVPTVTSYTYAGNGSGAETCTIVLSEALGTNGVELANNTDLSSYVTVSAGTVASVQYKTGGSIVITTTADNVWASASAATVSIKAGLYDLGGNALAAVTNHAMS